MVGLLYVHLLDNKEVRHPKRMKPLYSRKMIRAVLLLLLFEAIACAATCYLLFFLSCQRLWREC